MLTDPIADMLTRIRNALMAEHKQVKIPASKMKVKIAEILKEEGYINDFHLEEDNVQGTIVIDLRYLGGKASISGLKRVSKPGRRVYMSYRELPKIRNGLGIAIISTSSGLMTDHQARQKKVGGEVLCYIW